MVDRLDGVEAAEREAEAGLGGILLIEAKHAFVQM